MAKGNKPNETIADAIADVVLVKVMVRLGALTCRKTSTHSMAGLDAGTLTAAAQLLAKLAQQA